MVLPVPTSTVGSKITTLAIAAVIAASQASNNKQVLFIGTSIIVDLECIGIKNRGPRNVDPDVIQIHRAAPTPTFGMGKESPDNV